MHVRVLVFASWLAFSAVVSTPSQAQQTERADSDARTLFGLGNTAYQEGRYRAALDYFQQAYDLSHRPQLLFNVGQAADRLRDDRRALEAFEAYLRDVPESPDREAIQARVLILRDALARATPAVAPAEVAATTEAEATSTAPTEAPERGSAVPGIIVASGGGAVMVVGAVILAMGMSDASSVEGAADGSSYADVADAYDRAPTRITVGTVLLGVGVAATATGIVLAIKGGRSPSDDSASLRLHVQPMGLSLRGTF